MTHDHPPTVDEQIAWCLARRCRPRDVLVIGVATPLAAAAAHLARSLLVPDIVLLAATAVDPPPGDAALAMVSPEWLAERCVGMLAQPEILDAIARGRVTLQFISPAQVDGRGTLNASRVRRPDGTLRRLPGSLAIADTAGLLERLVVYRADHSPRFLAEQVDFVTGAPGRVEAIVTSRAVLEREDGGFRIASIHPGETVDSVLEGCGFALALPASPVPVTEAPPPEALRLLRTEIDPHGIRRLETRDGRAQALAALADLTARAASSAAPAA